MTDEVYAKVECIAIPDGIFKRDGQSFLRLSLVLRPDPTDDPSAVILREWPARIPELQFEVRFAAGGDLDQAVPLMLTPEYEPQERSMSASATDWWQNHLWTDNVLADYVELMRSSSFQPVAVGFSSYSFLAEMAKRRVESDIEMGLLSAFYRTGADPKGLNNLKSMHPAIACRLEDPADPASHLADIQELVAREVFADIPVGDAVGTLVANAGGYQVTPGKWLAPPDIDKFVQACFVQSENAILGRPTRAVEGMASSEKWNPFTPNPPEELRPSSDFFSNRYEPSIFGARVKVAQPSALSGQGPGQKAHSFELSRARLAVAAFEQMMSSTTSGAAVDCSDDTLENVALHHVAGLQANPALRKFVRLIVDIPVPLNDIPTSLIKEGKGTGVVSVTVQGPAAGTRKTATAFILDSSVSLFEPCPEHSFSHDTKRTSKVPSLPLDRGVVMLDVRRQDKNEDKDKQPARFRMDIVDATAGFYSLRQTIQATLQASRKGISANQASGEPASLKTRGLMLIDTEANVPAVMAREFAAQARAADVATTLYFAEALVDGYRPDVVRIIASNVEVFPLATRSIGYGVIENALKEAKLKLNPYEATADRDEGYISSGAKIVDNKNAPQRQFTSEQLFCWTGNNLGLPTSPQKNDPPMVHGLPTTITVDFKPGYKAPILRVGGRYRYMLRARKLNGSSVPISVSKKLALQYALGDEHGEDYLFMPVERTPAPTVLVPAGQRLVQTDQEDDQPSSQVVLLNPGETATRILVSPRIEFDLAEQQGQFDSEPTTTEYRKYGTYRRLSRDKNGSFPPYVDARAPTAVQQALLFKVLQTPDPSSDIKQPYYVDRSLCLLGCSLMATKATTHHAITSGCAEGVSFWNRRPGDKAAKGQGFEPEKIRPVLLECAAVRSGLSGVSSKGERSMQFDGQAIIVHVLRVEVAPGDTLLLNVWTNRTAEFSLQQPLLISAWEQLTSRMQLDTSVVLETYDSIRKKNTADQEDWWSKLTCGNRIPALNEVVTFRIEHAVSLPLQPPRFLQVFGCTRAKDAQEWKKLCASGARRADQPDADTTFTWGIISFDRKTTGTLWAEAIWREVDPALARLRTTAIENDWEIEQEGLWSWQPGIGQGRLFDIQTVPAMSTREGEDAEAYAARANRLDLLKDDQGVLRNLAGDFKSEKARRILVRLLAGSRFAAPSTNLSDPANCSASATRDDFFAALAGGPCPTGVEEIWLAATRPPAPPRLMRDQGSLYQRRFDSITSGLSDGHRGKRLTHVYRCWLDSDWFSSGEGEKLAIVCRDPSQGEQPDWLLAKVSRWGGDMTMRPPIYLQPAPSSLGDPTFLDPRQIVGMTPEVSELSSASWDKREETSTSFEGVRLALLEPKFHSGTGRWYCDIEMTPAASFRVCLRLSLSRYQKNAIEGCHLSEPVLADAFVLHQPWNFSAVRNKDIVEIFATGPAYTQRAPMLQGLMSDEDMQGFEGQAAEPLVVAELERLDRSGGGPLPVMSLQGQRVMTTSRQAVRKEQGWPTAVKGIEEGWTRWVMQLIIPPEEDEARYAVRLTLASAHANSRAEQGSDIDGALVYLPEPLVVQLEI